MYRTLIWSTDGSEGSEAALAHALLIAELCGARIVAVHCDQRLFGPPDAAGPLRERIRGLQLEGHEIELVFRHTRREAADEVAALAAELDADLVVCGTRGLGTFAGAFLGSFTHRLLYVAPCPVLAVQGSCRVRERSDEHELAVLA